MRFRKADKHQDGFTLVEMAVVVAIIGFLMSAAFLTIAAMLAKKSELSTLKRMEVIADAISIYAQHNMRVPCPANPAGAGPEPFGAEWGSGAAGTNYGDCIAILNAAQREGIVPYFTLGIPVEYIRDEWGNFFTYRVSPVVTNTPLDPGIPTTETGVWCLTQPVWHDGADHINPAKAAFCCGTRVPNQTDRDTDILLTGPHNIIVMPSRQAGGEGGDNADYRNPTAGFTTVAQLQNRFMPLFPAYVLVSHGQNGFGAFNGIGAGRVPGPGAWNAEEAENGDGDNRFFITDRLSPVAPSASGGGPDLYRRDLDDIVFWQSQAQVMSRLGETSCARPWNQ
ncbi:MAG: type II secretion system protein [Proteobacteria bacterium]|nr:type II secretion system protein [Pseudomonadota bacterium]